MFVSTTKQFYKNLLFETFFSTRVVEDMQGCVNKVSIFDKDLMFLVIFGLRGFKHELESQIGLRCAAECRLSISALPHVKTTSVAVTTGLLKYNYKTKNVLFWFCLRYVLLWSSWTHFKKRVYCY